VRETHRSARDVTHLQLAWSGQTAQLRSIWGAPARRLVNYWRTCLRNAWLACSTRFADASRRGRCGAFHAPYFLDEPVNRRKHGGAFAHFVFSIDVMAYCAEGVTVLHSN
jgi:hypothetical protein